MSTLSLTLISLTLYLFVAFGILITKQRLKTGKSMTLTIVTPMIVGFSIGMFFLFHALMYQ
ncbi:MAG: hypothetical protein P8H56_00870 [Crocinitomicaceae bacterium]|nr:hypothetical protein [Crocinitomicaceae bacterium]